MDSEATALSLLALGDDGNRTIDKPGRTRCLVQRGLLLNEASEVKKVERARWSVKSKPFIELFTDWENEEIGRTFEDDGVYSFVMERDRVGHFSKLSDGPRV